MAMEGLGAAFNIINPADDVYISLADCAGISFSVFEVDGATSCTITFGTTAAGGTTSTPDIIDHYYQRSNDTVDGKWVRVTQTASETYTPSDATGDHSIAYVSAEMAPDGAKYVKCTADGSAVVSAILHGLKIQRKPENLRSVLI